MAALEEKSQGRDGPGREFHRGGKRTAEPPTPELPRRKTLPPPPPGAAAAEGQAGGLSSMEC